MIEPSKEQLEEIGYIIVDAAYDIFCQCGAESDFCVQHVGDTIVFGGTNRLLYHPLTGFTLDASYCTSNFIEKFNRR